MIYGIFIFSCDCPASDVTLVICCPLVLRRELSCSTEFFEQIYSIRKKKFPIQPLFVCNKSLTINVKQKQTPCSWINDVHQIKYSSSFTRQLHSQRMFRNSHFPFSQASYSIQNMHDDPYLSFCYQCLCSLHFVTS